MKLVFLVRPGRKKLKLERPPTLAAADYVVSLTAPATENAANKQLLEFLSEITETPKSQIRIGGLKSRRKTVEGLDKERLEKWLETHGKGH